MVNIGILISMDEWWLMVNHQDDAIPNLNTINRGW